MTTRLPMLSTVAQVPPCSVAPNVSKSGAFVVYRGPSAFDGREIVAILTGAKGKKSSNAKTGPMAQLFILVSDEHPRDAQKSGHDVTVCGTCPYRPSVARGVVCYATQGLQGMATGSTWKANRDLAVNLAGALAALVKSGISLRLGSYGDPAALPESVVAALVGACRGKVTGYTHAWRTQTWARAYMMASADSLQDHATARAQGWRTFRVTTESDLATDEILCPYETRKVQCATCGLCDGARVGNVKSIAIHAHN